MPYMGWCGGAASYVSQEPVVSIFSQLSSVMSFGILKSAKVTVTIVTS